MENKKHLYEPTGECIWGDNKIALKKLYELTRNKYIEDNGFELFYSSFLDNHYIGSERNKINLIKNHRLIMSHFLNEIKKYFLQYYQLNYTKWIIDTVNFKEKPKDSKRVNEILNLIIKEGSSKDKVKKQLKDLDKIIKEVDKYYLSEDYPKNEKTIINTSLNNK